MARRRPLMFLALSWMLGILVGRELTPHVPAFYLWLMAVALLSATGALYSLRHPQWPLGLLLATVALGALFYAQARLPIEQLYPLLDRLKTVRGVVVNYPVHQDERSSFVFRPGGLPGALQIFYYHRQGPYKPIHYGDELELEARFEVPWPFEDFNYREHWLTRNIWAVGSLWSARQIKHEGAHRGQRLLEWGYQARLYLFDLIDRYIPPEGSALLKGLLFGERAYLSKEIETGFRDAGVMHVLAVSGMNLGILVALFWGALRLFGLSTTQIYVAILLLIFVYLLVVGFEVSLVRASLMFGFVMLGWVIAERGWILSSWIDPLQSLSAAALVILIATPQALFDVSFQLSFAATGGILMALQLALPLWQEQSERLRLKWGTASSFPKRALFRLGEMTTLFVLISTAAQLAVAPILAYHFHRVYLGAIGANLVVVPLATLALWLGVLVVMTALPALNPVAAGLAALEGWLLNLLVETTQFFAHLPAAYLVIDRGMQLVFLVALPPLLSAYALAGLRLAFPKLSLQIQRAGELTWPARSAGSP